MTLHIVSLRKVFLSLIGSLKLLDLGLEVVYINFVIFLVFLDFIFQIRFYFLYASRFLVVF